jgi:photosystem II stability/assembly factor-like uncharacterized protein
MYWIKSLLNPIRKSVLALVAIACFSVIAALPADAAFLSKIEGSPWQLIPLPTQESMLSVSFTDDSQTHAWMVGTNSALLESTDGGNTWQARKLELGDEKYRLTSVSFANQEGWMAGQPAILLHTTDGGESWERLPLSEKLPGSPSDIFAIEDATAEMITDVGAIYRTEDAGRTWQAQVSDAFGVFKSLHRSADGKYVAVSSRGNFFSTWKPGQSLSPSSNHGLHPRRSPLDDCAGWTVAIYQLSRSRRLAKGAGSRIL